jgi:hypothetical protein
MLALSIDTDTLFLLVFAAIFVGAVILLAVSVRRSKKADDTPEDLSDEGVTSDTETHADPFGTDEPSEDGWVAPEPVAYPARVVDMRVEIGNKGGSKRPKTGVSFLVTFLTDDGERMEYAVPEELYVTLNVDQTGTLVILNEDFFDFGDGEDTSDPQ